MHLSCYEIRVLQLIAVDVVEVVAPHDIATGHHSEDIEEQCNVAEDQAPGGGVYEVYLIGLA